MPQSDSGKWVLFAKERGLGELGIISLLFPIWRESVPSSSNSWIVLSLYSCVVFILPPVHVSEATGCVFREWWLICKSLLALPLSFQCLQCIWMVVPFLKVEYLVLQLHKKEFALHTVTRVSNKLKKESLDLLTQRIVLNSKYSLFFTACNC